MNYNMHAPVHFLYEFLLSHRAMPYVRRLIEKRISKKSDEPDGVDDVVDPRALSPLNRSRNRKSERKRTNNVINNSTTKVRHF